MPVWSPDGRHILVSAELTVPDAAAEVYLFTSEGDPVSELPDATLPFWLDSERFLAYRHSTRPMPDQPAVASAFLSSVARDDVIELVAPFGSATSNGQGAVAIGRLREAPRIERPDWIVWTANEFVSQPRPGFPVTWSALGDLVAVLHPITATRGIAGWLEIVSWPDLTTVFEDPERTVIDYALFDPQGHHVAFEKLSREGETQFAHSIVVIDLRKLSATDIPVGEHTTFRWGEDSTLIVLNAHASVETYSPTGERLAATPVDQFAIVETSSDGSTLMLYEGEEDEAVYVGPNADALEEILLPEGEEKGVTLSPDGERLAVVLADPSSGGTSDLLYLFGRTR